MISPNYLPFFNFSIINNVNKRKTRQKFLPFEDELLIRLVGDEDFPNWKEISMSLYGRTPRQCRERYQHYLAPGISKDPWTKDEDELIISLYSKYGPNWALISRHFDKKRTNNSIKNRWNNHLKKNNPEIKHDDTKDTKDNTSDEQTSKPNISGKSINNDIFILDDINNFSLFNDGYELENFF